MTEEFCRRCKVHSYQQEPVPGVHMSSVLQECAQLSSVSLDDGVRLLFSVTTIANASSIVKQQQLTGRPTHQTGEIDDAGREATLCSPPTENSPTSEERLWHCYDE